MAIHVSLYFVAQLARERVTVLTGEGSDETLAGSTTPYTSTLLNSKMDRV